MHPWHRMWRPRACSLWPSQRHWDWERIQPQSGCGQGALSLAGAPVTQNGTLKSSWSRLGEEHFLEEPELIVCIHDIPTK